jgi:hypothetical protein
MHRARAAPVFIALLEMRSRKPVRGKDLEINYHYKKH